MLGTGTREEVLESCRVTEMGALGFELCEVEYQYCIARVPVLHRAGIGTLRVIRLTEARVCAFGCAVPVCSAIRRLHIF